MSGMCNTAQTDGTALSQTAITDVFREPQRLSQPAVRTVVDLKPHEIRIYLAVIDHPRSTARELAAELDRQRHHVATVLRTLFNTGLITRIRTQRENEQVYVYEPVGLTDTKRILHRKVDEWTASVRAEINALGEPSPTAEQDHERD